MATWPRLADFGSGGASCLAPGRCLERLAALSWDNGSRGSAGGNDV